MLSRSHTGSIAAIVAACCLLLAACCLLLQLCSIQCGVPLIYVVVNVFVLMVWRGGEGGWGGGRRGVRSEGGILKKGVIKKKETAFNSTKRSFRPPPAKSLK